MSKSIETLKRELKFINDRILLIRQGKVREDKGISLKDAMSFKNDYETSIKTLENNINE